MIKNLLWGMGIIVVVVLLWIFGSVFGLLGTATSSVTGVINKTIDPNNVITSYEWFHDANANYNQRLDQIATHQSLSAALVGSEKTKALYELTAIQTSCRTLANNYNAASEKINKTIFKGQSLPETLDPKGCK